MAKIKINGDSSGYVELAAPNAAHNNTLELGPGTKILTDKNTHTGNIGIGTDNPDIYGYGGNLLTVSDSSTYTNLILASSDATNSGISFGGQTFRRAQIQGGNGSDSDLIFLTNSSNSGISVTERLRIDSSGNTNIGASASNTAIHASGLFNGATPKLEIKLGAAANSYTRLINITNPGGQTGSESLGRVGIKLSLGSEASSGESNKSGIIYAESTSAYNNATALCFATNNTEQLRITSAGDVGIGTNAPTTGNPSGAKYLHIHNSATNNSNSPAEIYFTNANTGPSGGSGGMITFYNRGFYFWNYADDDIHFGTGGAERFKFDHSLNILDFQSTSKIRLRGAASVGTTHAHLNIGSQGGANTDTRAIDIWGNWQDQESKSITWSHGTTDTSAMVCQQRVRYNQSPSSTVYEIGRLYHGQNTAAFPFQLQSTGTTTADLTIDGQIYNKNQSFVAYSTQSNNIQSSTKIDYTVSTSYASVFDNSNSRFTAQRAGLYLFYVRHWFIANQTGTVYLDMMKNVNSVKEFRVTHPTASSQYETIQGTALVYMAVHDYMEVNGSASGNASLHESSGERHSEFSGFYVSG